MQCYLHRRRIVEQVARDVGVHEDANYGSRSESREKRRPRAHRNNSQRGPASDHPPGEADDERFVVRSTGDGDPLDPRNWPLLLRCQNIAVMILLLFGPAWAGGAPALANSAARQEFGVSATAENLATALYLLGIGSGALFLAGPISETVGRTAAYLVPGACYLLFVAGSAMTPTFGGQLACRFLVGLFGSVTLSINGSSVRDQFRPVKRAFVFPVVAWANVVPPMLAPMCSGWIVSHPKLGWRWTEWMTLIVSATGWLVALLLLSETYFPLLLSWRAAALRQTTGDSRYQAEMSKAEPLTRRLARNIRLAVHILTSELVIAVLGGYLVLLYVLLFTFLSGFDYIFRATYSLESWQTGVCFGSIAAGATAFTLLAPGFYALARHRTEHVRGAPVDPEFRLWPSMVAGPLLPVALFWLGWTNRPSVSIWSGLAACFLFGAILIAIYVSAYEYIVDSYGNHAAIALAAVTGLRYVIASGMVVAARPMYESLGVRWTMTFLGCFAVLLAPAPWLFWMYGTRLRHKSPYAMGASRVS